MPDLAVCNVCGLHSLGIHLSFLIFLLRYIYLTAVKTFGFMSYFSSLFF